jgi:hypothetical protein
MLNDAQAGALESKVADARARQRQDKTHPLLINAQDGRLMPNVPRIRNNKKSHYVVYTGDPKATLESRMRWLKTLSTNGARRVIDTSEDAPFDIGKASKQELVDFAIAEYQITLDVNTDHRKLRGQVKTLAEQHEALLAKAKTVPAEDLA